MIFFEPFAEISYVFLLLNMSWLTVFDKCSVSNFGCQILDLPKDMLISLSDFLSDFGRFWQLWWHRHVQNLFEEQEPWLKLAVFHEIWRHLQLVACIENLAYQVKHEKSILIVFIHHHVIDQQTDYFKALLHNIIKRHSFLIQLKFISRAKSIQALETCKYWYLVFFLQVIHNLT